MTGIRQHSDEWHALRQASVGGSDMPVLLGLSPWKAEASLADEKRGLVAEEHDEQTSRRLRLGLALEPVIRREDEIRHGIRIRRVNRVHVHPDIPWAIASLDFERVGEKTIVETKASSSRRFGDELPRDVAAQVQWQMGVAGYPRAHVACLRSGSDLQCYDEAFDADVFAGMVAVAADFRRRLSDPDATFTENAASVRARYPSDDGTELAADAEVTEAVQALLAVRANKAVLEEDEERLETAIKARMAAATVLRGGDWRITWKTTKPREVTDWRLLADGFLRSLKDDDREVLVALHTRTEPGKRPFRIWTGEEEAA